MANRNMDDGNWWVGAIILLGGLSTISVQVFWFLRDGVWTSLSLIETVRKLATVEKPWAWLAEPHTWIGLHTVLNFIPVSATAIVIGLFGMAIAHASD